jgi:hypothetical protein
MLPKSQSFLEYARRSAGGVWFKTRSSIDLQAVLDETYDEPPCS